MRRVTTLLVAGLMVLSAFAMPAAAGVAAPQGDATQSQIATGDQGSSPVTTLEQDPKDERPDPENDTLGWEKGYWHNESIAVNVEDGLNRTEIKRAKYRSMARLEIVRDLEYKGDVPVNIVSREEYANRTKGREVSDVYRQHFNAKYEALFMVNESKNAIAVEQQNSAAGVGGFYSPSDERIVVITENTSSPGIDEITLSQELYHALQDQYGLFDKLNYSTRELHNAADGIVEGDANLADTLYQQRCGSQWNCLKDTSGGSGGGLDLTEINLGLYQLTFQPYSDGPAWVWQVYQSGGWDAVDQLYQNPPASTEQTIHPDKYGKDAPNYPSVADKSGENWKITDLGSGSVNFASFGEAGIYTMLWYPSWEKAPKNKNGLVTGPANVTGVHLFNHLSAGRFNTTINKYDTYNYDHRFSDGWDGDKMYTYVREGSSGYKETGYVWKINWDSAADAQELMTGYERLLKYHGANSVEGLSNTWTVPDSMEFGDAFSVEVNGDTVTIVNAPSMAELNDIRSDTITASDYAGDDGEVSTQELRTAISHWVTGQIDKETFQNVVQQWARS